MNTAYWINNVEQRHCPLCDNDTSILLSRHMQHHLDLNTVICKRCGFVYTNPLPSREVYDRFYAEAYADYYGHLTGPPQGQYRDKIPGSIQRRLEQIKTIRPLEHA